ILNDILIAGGDLRFDGYVGGTVRTIGGRLTISAPITHDLVVAGGNVIIEPKGRIGGDLLGACGKLDLSGEITGNTNVRAGTFTLDGVTHGSLDVKAEWIIIRGRSEGQCNLAATSDITIDDHAQLAAEVHYWTPDQKLDTHARLKPGQLIFDPILKIDRGRWYYSGATGFMGLIWYLGMALVLIFVLQYLFPKAFSAAGASAAYNPLASFGWGLLFVVTVPILAIVSFLLFIAAPLGVFLLLSYACILFLGGVLTALVAAYWLKDNTRGKWKPARTAFVALGMLILLRLIAATPFLGFPLFCILVCIAFGALLQNSPIPYFRKKAAN
ncbi:MAG: polymer-forming cytoskeletal protein, partial [Bacteroidetes bacterium]|nr:polymer-forming cytoskeletal protein [Bacteroidota bacterium]